MRSSNKTVIPNDHVQITCLCHTINCLSLSTAVQVAPVGKMISFDTQSFSLAIQPDRAKEEIAVDIKPKV